MMGMTTIERELERLDPKLEQLSDAERQRIAPSLVALLKTRCDVDGAFWLKFVRTRDEADPEAPVKHLPRHDYLLDLWKILDEQQMVAIAKSRQMKVSWLIAAFCTWTARSKPHRAIYWQSQQYTDAAGMIALPVGGTEGRCQFIESHLDPWLQKPYKASDGLLQYDNGSMIKAVAGGADKIRGQVFSIYVGDEFAYQEEQTGVHTTILPLIQKGARAILVSTPNGDTNEFATIYHGRATRA